jgi:hypothetical protein
MHCAGCNPTTGTGWNKLRYLGIIQRKAVPLWLVIPVIPLWSAAVTNKLLTKNRAGRRGVLLGGELKIRFRSDLGRGCAMREIVVDFSVEMCHNIYTSMMFCCGWWVSRAD